MKSFTERLFIQVSPLDHSFNKKQTLHYTRGYAHEQPAAIVEEACEGHSNTELIRTAGYSPAASTGAALASTRGTRAGQNVVLPKWVVNNNKVNSV